VQPLWCHKHTVPLRGLSLARERGWLLTWDAGSSLSLFNASGERQAVRPFPFSVAAAASADDGGSFAVAGAQGEVLLLAPDLSNRWERRLSHKALAVALDPFGLFVAAADAGGNLQVYEAGGEAAWRAEVARPLHHLAFVPEKPLVLGAADFGLVACFDRAGRCDWRDGLVAHVGSLAVDGAGATAALACFSDGLHLYAAAAGQPRRAPLPIPCRLAAVSYTGDALLTVDLEGRVHLRRPDGQARDEYAPGGPVVALALAALADHACLALADGTLIDLEIKAR
jgi:hypothetical protein